jgi:hypothetical protein
VGQVVISHLETSDEFLDVDLNTAKAAYQDAYQKGKEFVSGLQDEEDTGKDVFKSLQKLGQLREQGVITEEEFEAQKQKLLDRL